ncbi:MULTISPECIES: fatty acid desaturase [unclassified Nocardioides]|uniref:fatty acid desaturase n=1 Tax=unclassified Nocardioides TaxID=2615069 RepID=UPI0007011A1C|nr:MULTISPECIES: fatty acid desaturase [unclassified Nocardioides]KRA27861.1 alkane 1-monooxygenase [Nocardioides sp. Root614]KRA86676.1 alkane 1-monooxygenase [Nocardioides sp. Root682]
MTNVESITGSPKRWKDKKRYLWMLGLVVPTLPLAAIALHDATGQTVWLWLTPVMFFAVIPLLDLVTGYDDTNPPDDVIEALENDRYYRWVTYLYLPVQYVGFILAIWYLATADLSVIAKIGLAISIGTVGGVAINTAHELGHKRESVERWASKIALAQTFYGHFFIEHNRGHHVRVATPDDPASSRMGESVYRFWPRTVLGSLTSSWHLEAKRYQRKGTHPFHIGNDVLNAWLMTVVLWGGLMLWLGLAYDVSPLALLPYLALQAVMGFSLLEVVNYMEHYGMKRQLVGPPEKQRFERVQPSHSWNSNNIATNVLLYHLQRHSDHHANPTRRYQTLRDFKDAPVLPTGYTGMIVVAMFPPLFRWMMDKRVVAHYDGDIRHANLMPSKREKLLRKYPAPVAVVEEVLEDTSAHTFNEEVLAAKCPGCGYTYEVEVGNELEGFAAGTAWKDIPDDWCCPDCGVREKVDFTAVDPRNRVGA